MRATINTLLLAVIAFAAVGKPKPFTPAGVPSPGRDGASVPVVTPSAPAGVSDVPVLPLVTPDKPAETQVESKPLAQCKVVYFTATWCGPCRVGKPFAKAACVESDAEYVEVDVDQFSAYSKRWGVDKCPTIIVTVNGKERWRHEGVLQEAELALAIDAARRPIGWEVEELRAEIDDHSRRIDPKKRWSVAGQTVTEHLTRDHDWPLATVKQLTEDERHWLHDATHRGRILP